MAPLIRYWSEKCCLHLNTSLVGHQSSVVLLAIIANVHAARRRLDVIVKQPIPC